MFFTQSVEFSNLLNCANLPNLQNRRLLDVATLMYKIKYGLVPSNVVDIFIVVIQILLKKHGLLFRQI